MRSVHDRAQRAGILAAGLAALAAGAAPMRAPGAAQAAAHGPDTHLSAKPPARVTDNPPALSEADVASAIDKVKADPNIAAHYTSHRLRWNRTTRQKDSTTGGGWIWLRTLFGWMAETGLSLMWVAGALTAALLALYVMRFRKARGMTPGVWNSSAPTHVRDLDIRPETLPEDIGAEALALWSRTERRQALALLYRGLLSRLAHLHRLPIQHASTEGDCIQLAAQHLSAEPASYATRLVRVWQRAAYGGEEPVNEDMQALCAEFSSMTARDGLAARHTA